ncbi:MAG: hypothetical protein HKN25_07940 [Pyrinomonadaceae bacterium]|nr:hypothetical protein [Pyrinomonadaceae bacterium]
MKKAATATPEDMGQTRDFRTLREASPKDIPSELLATLIEEVRNEEFEKVSSYNRFHNRHNRTR